MRAHAILSASGAHRWLICTPSARLEEEFPDSESEFASEGTFAHLVCETQLRYLLGRTPQEDYAKACEELRADPRFTPDFMAHCKTYVDFCMAKIQEVREKTPDAAVLVEERLDFSHVVPEGFGTGDLVIIADGVLDVVDLKFGKGLPVSAVENEQEMLYGVGALEAYSLLFDIDTVRLTIVQPRISEEPSIWEISAEALRAWAKEFVIPRAALAWNGGGDFVAGDHCKFCRAKGPCRARAEANLALAQHEFKAPELLSDGEVAEILTQADQLKSWANDIQSYALSRVTTGHKLPGWKLVAGRSNRAYTDPDEVAKTLVAAGVPEAVIYERSLLGVTAMEKAITKKRFTELLEGLIRKPPGKPTLVESSDPRAEIEASALDGFEVQQPGEPAS